MAGRILTGNALRTALMDGRAFERESIAEANIRSATYDLTLARDLLVVPEGEGGEAHVYRRGEYCPNVIELARGATALVSSRELAQFDWTIWGSLGARSSLAVQGLLIQTGLGVDPGYGLQYDDTLNAWIPESPPQRLYFVVTNVGPGSYYLRPEIDTIARIQLVECNEPVDKRYVPPPEVAGRFDQASADTQPLTFFSYVMTVKKGEEIKQSVKDAQLAIDDRVTRVELDSAINVVRSELQTVQTASHHVVVFGVFLLTATLFAVAFISAITILDRLPQHASHWLEGLAASGLCVLFLAVIVAMLKGFDALKTLSNMRHAMKRPTVDP